MHTTDNTNTNPNPWMHTTDNALLVIKSSLYTQRKEEPSSNTNHGVAGL